MILQMLGITVLSIVLAWGAYQLIFKPLFREYDAKMSVEVISEETANQECAGELQELEAEIEMDIKSDSKPKKMGEAEFLS